MMKKTLLSLTLATGLITGLYATDKAYATDPAVAAESTAAEPHDHSNIDTPASVEAHKVSPHDKAGNSVAEKSGKKAHKARHHQKHSSSHVDHKAAGDATTALNSMGLSSSTPAAEVSSPMAPVAPETVKTTVTTVS